MDASTANSAPVACPISWERITLVWPGRLCRQLIPYLLLGILGYSLFFVCLGDRDLWSSHEGRAAQDAQSLLLDRAWGLPRLFSLQADLQKPPLFYWLVAGVAWIRGGSVDGWSVRFPAAACGLACVWLLYAFGARCGRPRSGFIAAVLLATSMHFTWLAHIGRIDMPLTFAVAICVCFSHLGLNAFCSAGGRAGWGWFAGVYLATAAALLLKGPIGLVLPLAVVTAQVAVEWFLNGRQSQNLSLLTLLHGTGLWWGIPLILLLVAPWFIWVNQHTNGEFFRVFFWKHNVERGLGSGSLHVHPWWFYIPRMAFDFLPWSPLLLPATWWLFKRAWKGDALARFAWIWCTGILVVLSCSSFKRADYLLPAFPGAALLIACAVDRLLDLRPQLQKSIVALGAVCACCSISGWYYYLAVQLPTTEPERELRSFAATIRRIAPAPQPIIFFRTESHALAFHVGRPVDSILEWENVDTWASRAGNFFVVMPAEMVAEWPAHIHSGTLIELARNDPGTGSPHEEPLVLLKTCPHQRPSGR
jgi:4-amino-4-deoxy-L-arabinose transferase-like glycosyltransferase